MAEVIIAHGKHGDALYATALGLLKQRVEEGYWYDDPSEYEWIIASNDEQAAWSFLDSRSEYEYEGVEAAVVHE